MQLAFLARHIALPCTCYAAAAHKSGGCSMTTATLHTITYIKLAAHSVQDAIRQAQSLPESLSEHNLKQTLPGLLPALVTDRLQPQHCHYLQFAAIQVTSLSEPVPCLLHLHRPLCKLSLWPSCGGGAATAFMLLVMLLARRIVCACISSWQHIYLLADASSSKCTMILLTFYTRGAATFYPCKLC